MLVVKVVEENDVQGIRDLLLGSYGKDYPYKNFYDINFLKKTSFNNNILMLVCIDDSTNKVVGTASVVMDIGAFTDLTGEFGRLVVHPDFRSQGVGKLLMEKRMEYVNERLHVGIVEARAIHPFAQKISDRFHFVVVGFLPQKHLLDNTRESVVHLVQYFGNALALRKKNPHLIPEIIPLAKVVLENLKLDYDIEVDEDTAPYPHNNDFSIEELSSKGYTHLLRIQRGRTKNREVYGSLRLHYGFFRLMANEANYIVALANDNIVGAIGFVFDQTEKSVKIFELIAIDGNCVRFLFLQLHKKLSAAYFEIDISAYAPRIQRTLIELGYIAVSYIPAFAFHEIERLDIIRMVRLEIPSNIGKINLIPSVQKISSIVLKELYKKRVFLDINKEMFELPIFRDLSNAQLQSIAMISTIKNFPMGHIIYNENEDSPMLIIILKGKVDIFKNAKKIGSICVNECFGEMGIITSQLHSATAISNTETEAITIEKQKLKNLFRSKPDIAAIFYKNLARSIGEKLKRVNKEIVLRKTGENDV